jgi:hypothetical protein
MANLRQMQKQKQQLQMQMQGRRDRGAPSILFNLFSLLPYLVGVGFTAST